MRMNRIKCSDKPCGKIPRYLLGKSVSEEENVKPFKDFINGTTESPSILAAVNDEPEESQEQLPTDASDQNLVMHDKEIFPEIAAIEPDTPAEIPSITKDISKAEMEDLSYILPESTDKYIPTVLESDNEEKPPVTESVNKLQADNILYKAENNSRTDSLIGQELFAALERLSNIYYKYKTNDTGN